MPQKIEKNKKDFEKNIDLQKKISKKVEELSYKYLENFTKKKEVISKLMNFETSK
jgi:ribosomal protein S15P/S13E